jgi:hypothetical protein
MPILPEPAWDESQQIEVDPSSICATDTRPSIITGAIMSLLRDHFSRDTNITNEKLRNLIWKPKSDDENEQSMIHIEPWHMYDADHLQQRPAAYVSRGQVSVQRIALRDRSLTHLSRRTGNQEGKDMIKLISCRHQVICCSSKSDMAADRLAEEIFYMLLEYGPAIQEDLKLGGFHVTAMTPSQEIDDDHENFMVGVQILWTNAHSWKLKPIAPILKNVAIVVNET